MKNNRRLYKRILAIMLVILLVLPQGISSVVSRAEGETANASWSDDLATLTATFDNLGENTIMAATATPDGKSTVEGAVSGNQVTFSITDKIRKDTNISFNLFKASEENPEVADTTPFATVQWNNDKNNFEVTSNDISVVIDNNNTVTISITGDAASYAYLSDFSSTVTVTVDSKSCTKDMPAGTSLEFTSSDGDLANANYKTDQKANVSFADTSIAQIDLDILTERLIWSNGSIEASINEENVLTISTNSSAPAADLSKYAASVSVSVAGETAKTISFSEGSASVTQDLDDYGWYLKEGDTVSLSFKDRTDAASVVTNINNLKVGSTNYYTINVTGDVTVTGNGVKDNKILKTSTDKSAKVIAEGKFISSIKVDGVDKTSNVEIESESKEFKRTVYAISEINSDININVETIDKTGLVTLSTTELSPLFSYGITVKSLPYIIADNISYDCGDSVSEDKVEHFLSISGTTIAVKYESGDNKITSVTGTPTDTNPITTGFSINYYLKDSSDNDIKMGTLTGTVKVDALCNYIDGIKFTSKKTGEEIAAYQKNNIYLLAGDASVNIYLNDAGKSKLKKYRFNGDTTTIPSDGKITFSVDKEEDVELEFIATSEGSSDEKIFSALKFGVDATKPTVTDINCTNEGTVEEKKNDITEQAEGKVITFSFGDTNSGIDYTINKPFVSMTENATSSDLQEGDNGEQGDKFEFEIGKGKLTLKKLRKIPANYYIHVFDNVGNEKIYTVCFSITGSRHSAPDKMLNIIIQPEMLVLDQMRVDGILMKEI